MGTMCMPQQGERMDITNCVVEVCRPSSSSLAGGDICRWRELVVVCAPAFVLLASLVFHRTCHAGSITSITVVTKLRLCRAPSRAFLGLQRRPLQLVDRPGVHDVGNLNVLHLLISFAFHGALKG